MCIALLGIVIWSGKGITRVGSNPRGILQHQRPYRPGHLFHWHGITLGGQRSFVA